MDTEANEAGYRSGRSDASKDKNPIVRQTRNGLRWEFDTPDYWSRDEQRSWGEGYVEGYNDYSNDERRDPKKSSTSIRDPRKKKASTTYYYGIDLHGGRDILPVESSWSSLARAKEAAKYYAKAFKGYTPRIIKIPHERDPQSLTRLQSELAYARENYRFWARQEHRLTRDEYAQKMEAERRVHELEAAIAFRGSRSEKAGNVRTD